MHKTLLSLAGDSRASRIFTMQYPRSLLVDFRVIPLGDLDLRHEIRLNYDTGIIDRRQIRGPVRRMHSARIHGSESTMTVAIYEGDKAEENWREAISKYSNLRHPNIIQLFGTARAPRLHAAIFHDELIPARQMAEKYNIAPICTVYFRYFLVGPHISYTTYFMIDTNFTHRDPDPWYESSLEHIFKPNESDLVAERQTIRSLLIWRLPVPGEVHTVDPPLNGWSLP
ncbi:hypothetical protein B0H17DRAFT_681910 [Mycena rosella]|uniref:Protein kinase domain-containing protein n=1 Tax=Mycena rosella TaxID=1033263 RepID=A0AAD7BAF7_MYCRO|nr:hypothetical protein B0H17DRAFT_681910 [Mycena rosella]